MAKQEKYRIDFMTGDGYSARVMIYFEGYTGAVINLEGGARPFVLREFNTEDNLLKPLRPQLAEIEIVTNGSGVTLDSFLANSETDIEILFQCFDFAEIYWRGFIMQDDYVEEWQNQNHVIKITATEGLGILKNVALSNNGAEIQGMTSPWDLIQYAMQGLPLDWTKYMVINNLYHDSMVSTMPNTSLTQARIEPKTFETDPTIYDNCYNVLEKINSAFSQTIFLYRNMWHIVRMEELYTNGNLRGFFIDNGIPSTYNKRYDVSVGIGQEIKPISPDMLRFIKRITKEDILKFNFIRFDEIIKNSSFIRGNVTVELPTEKRYSVQDWDLLEGDMFIFSAPAYGAIERIETYLSVNGPIIDSYVQLQQTIINPSAGITSKDYLMRSESLQVFIGEKIEISIDHQFNINFTTKETMKTFYVRLITGSSPSLPGYTLTNEGKWEPWEGVVPWTENVYAIDVEYNGRGDVKPTEWNTSSVTAEPIPVNGFLTVWLVCPNQPWALNQVRYFKSFKFDVISRFDGYQEGLQYQEAKFTKNTSSKYNDNSEIFLDDSFNSAYKGSIYESDGVTLTDNNWYRYRYPGERNAFHKQNLIAKWSQNRYNRSKIDANFFGLIWQDQFSLTTIGLINTVKFIDDDPNKIYAITNLKEIDFAAGTWSASLQEVWDNDRDAGTVAKSLVAPVKTGVFTNRYTIGYTSPNQTFLSTTDDKMIYTGYDVITATITASASGLIQDVFPDVVPPATQNVVFSLKKNSTVIATNTITLTTNPSDGSPRSFSIFLSSGSITITPNDVYEVVISTNIVKITIQAGSFQLPSYTIPKALDYDTYSEKYIYK